MLKQFFKYSFIIILLIIFTLTNSHYVNASLSSEINSLRQTIDSKNKKIQELKKKQKEYQAIIQSKKNEALSLENELEILDNKLKEINTNIESLKLEIEKTNDEINVLNLEIEKKEKKIKLEKTYLESLLKEINFKDNVSDLEILLMYNNFSDYFQNLNAYKSLQDELQNTVITIQEEKNKLEEEKTELEKKEKDLAKQKKDLEIEKDKLNETLIVKKFYLEELKNSEAKFQELLNKAKKEESTFSSKLSKLENELRLKLKEQKQTSNIDKEEKNNLDFLNRKAVLRWPVPHNRGISCYFHDPDYPFRYVFPHTGIDIRAYQGTPIHAAEAGYVARARDNGMGYSYIMIIHSDGLSTVYGHVSKIYVKQGQYVNKGDIIALSGGMPGTPGAGRYSTGPHLHFEVRLNGIPVDPLRYLP